MHNPMSSEMQSVRPSMSLPCGLYRASQSCYIKQTEMPYVHCGFAVFSAFEA